MVFIAGDDRVFRLTEVADLRDDPTETVVLFNGGTNRIVGGVHAEAVAQGVQYLCFQLGFVVIQAGPVAFHGWVDDGGDEAVVLHRLQQGKMLLHALHGGAALRTEQSVQIVEAALDGPFQDTADIGTVAVCHVVGRDLCGAAVGGPKAAGKAARQVQQHFGYIVAVISQSQLALRRGALDQLVVGLLQKVLKPDQVLQVFHGQNSFSMGTSPRIWVVGLAGSHTIYSLAFFNYFCNYLRRIFCRFGKRMTASRRSFFF